MVMDPLSPIAPARIRTLLLPVGRIKRSRFLKFVDRLQPECMVRLGDISPDAHPDRNMFSPLAFPSGVLFYELSTSLPTPSHLALSPFEQFREPLLVIGIADAKEYAWLSAVPDAADVASKAGRENFEESDQNAEELRQAVDDLREQYPRVYLHRLMVFDCPHQTRPTGLLEDTILVPPSSQLKTTTMKTFMCDLTATLLAEMTTLARSLQALPTVKSPTSSQPGSNSDGSDWTMPDSLSQLQRRSSQAISASRPDSPATNAQNNLQRMSMPVLPSSSSTAASVRGDSRGDSRSTSPITSDTQTPPARTFDEIPGVSASTVLSRTNSSTPQSNATLRDSSRDRVSVHGFGPGGVGERARNKGRGRVGIVIGTLYMCAGRWQDAMKELVENATRARAFSDHLWHAKGLENILVCLLLFAWSGLDFQVPSICYPASEKSSTTKSPQHTPSNSVSDVSTVTLPKPASHSVAMQNLNSVLPDLINMTLNLYSRAANFPGEALPPLAFSECIIRFSKILTAMNLCGGKLNDDALQHLIRGNPLVPAFALSLPRPTISPTRYEIAALVFRAFPTPLETGSMTATDRIMILAGVASVLSSLGLQRKKAIVMKEFVASLIPGLVQARKVGAAEMGVHPAAGLAALNMASGGSSGAGSINLGDGEVESGIDAFLGLLCEIYGIPDQRTASSGTPGHPSVTNGSTHQDQCNFNGDDTSLKRLLHASSMRSFGNLNLKLDILRMCIDFCEALPDFQGVLHYTAALLRIAGPGTAPHPNSTEVFVSLAREEQIRLATKITRMVGAASSLGLQNIETDYWDDFLLRGLYTIEAPRPRLLIQHRQDDLSKISSTKDGPFIHNPFLKQVDADLAEHFMVANEEYGFVVALQNPYDFEVEVESLRLAGDGTSFTAFRRSLMLGPYRTQKFSLGATAGNAGTLSITGCIVKIKGCRERTFPIYADPWRLEPDTKIKNIGLQASRPSPPSRPVSGESTTSQTTETSAAKIPAPLSMAMTVVPEQPLVVLSSISLPQSALMVLEGERKKFSITLHNISKTTSVDFIHISFQDSASAAIQAAMSNKDLPPSELHELEVQLAHYPSFRWCKASEDEAIEIKPGEKASFDIEVIGRVRLTDGIIQFDYANLGMPRSEVKDRFFTRQLAVPISITVNASIQLHRPDILPFTGDFAWSNYLRKSGQDQLTPSRLRSESTEKGDNRFHKLLSKIGITGHDDEHCMLLLDLRNAWPNPLSISIQVRDKPPNHEIDDKEWPRAYTVHEVIQPGHVNRIAVILPKTYLKNPFAAIPSLNPANQRQFVVSASQISPEIERANREAFWYRDGLLKCIRGSWKEEGNSRHGEIDLRGIRLTSRMVEAIKLDDLKISMHITSDYEDDDEIVRQTGAAKFEVYVDEFLTLKTKIHNRSSTPIYPLLRLQPSLANLPHNAALDLDKRFSWTGVLQRKLPVLQPGQTMESELGIVLLCSGVFEVSATIDEIRVWVDEKEKGEGARVRSGTGLLQGHILAEAGLRAWHSKEPCTITAKQRGLP
ncbi:hypercellular protein-like protein HypA [Mytilinidion resinicola]|uniref:Hypercellular protein-like protein HypA n=1 Tax=Mytilinidion resinicola TaxID=574789 RepID=A0A6A6YQ49_9PEZI|nr:hypercellular protein-like protein HypA [Mytilinidion resinicola]KAF2810649.1 hypercellular protein-like protein HypA [Mytilinidion resinicola]